MNGSSGAGREPEVSGEARAPAAGSALAPRIGVLALQGAVAEHADLLHGLGAQVVPVRRPDQLASLSGLVIPGGESTAIARLAHPQGLLPAVRRRMDEGMPVLGTCAGLILLSETVVPEAGLAGLDTIGGLHVRTRRNAYGRQRDSFEAEVSVSLPDPGGSSPGPRPMRAAFIRAPLIEQVGEGAEVIATHGGRPVAVRQGRVLAASFHPELTGDDRLHRELVRIASSPEALAASPEAALQAPRPAPA
ncbi:MULTISPECIES: pyridoxal 5'-phosphate synthase glutaminase subunit PdxT [Brevibacterium]|uniref:Pyridoxal 5'-phosphate synthase subunit PdxT n=1 Tax=Brevibacterium salitolerans TaxID=1403566 RepID=A0ABN2X0C5_9MICO|nr:pyridoxal 5'-phosphate synthase glutaminase subunit PdxT [Brevibacterium sp.]